MGNNSGLYTARRAKKDEFYTSYEEVTAELDHYREYFENKRVLLNCNDTEKSNFWKYFKNNFRELKLRSLMGISYSSEPEKKRAYTLEIDSSNADEVIKTELPEGETGDFRSIYCIELMTGYDIICTNPPFSLFRDYMYIVRKSMKKFIVLGNMNAITYRDIFPHIQDNEFWFGYGFNKSMMFEVPDEYSEEEKVKVPSLCWYTNIDHKQHHTPSPLTKSVLTTKYEKYMNFDGIEVEKLKDIPKDYEGVMGVPITFLGKYDPDQFEIVGMGFGRFGHEAGVRDLTPEQKAYRRSTGNSISGGALYLKDENGNPKCVYARVLIRNLVPERS